MRTTHLLLALALALTIGGGCHHREDVWDAPPNAVAAVGLSGSAALVDDTAHRALMLTVNEDLTLSPTSLAVGHGYAASAATPDGSRLLVLSHGDVPRTKPVDEQPSLTLIDGGTKPRLIHQYTLSDPLSGLAVDPEGAFAVVYPSADDTSFVQNPNELSIVDLGQKPSATNPTPVTLRSFGGRPQSFFFTPTLALPGGSRRLLAVLTDRDVGIIDLSAPQKGDITVPLSSTGEAKTPLQIAVTDGAAGDTTDARLAVRVSGDSSVILVDLLPVPMDEQGKTAHDFKPTPNIVFAGGPPTDIAFVTTDGGLRLAAVVPSQNALALVDPATGIAQTVDLGAPFEHISIVTGIVGPTTMGADVALLWGSSSPVIAFVALGSTVGKPYKSVERLTLAEPVAKVLDVPAPNDRLKILTGNDGYTFFVLDLVARTASPILATPGSGVSFTVSPDGQRAWVMTPALPDIASLSLADLHPQNLQLELPVMNAFDVARAGGGRALVAVHDTPLVDLTVLDGDHPSLDTAVDYSSVLLGGLQ